MGLVERTLMILRPELTLSFTGSGMSRAYATETAAKGWLIPQGVQMLPAVLLLVLIWFTPGKLAVSSIVSAILITDRKLRVPTLAGPEEQARASPEEPQ